MSDCAEKTPMGVRSWMLARWKPGGGGTCLWVAEPGMAQSGTAGFGAEASWAKAGNTASRAARATSRW
jgi:hypothetical protein